MCHALVAFTVGLDGRVWVEFFHFSTGVVELDLRVDGLIGSDQRDICGQQYAITRHHVTVIRCHHWRTCMPFKDFGIASIA